MDINPHVMTRGYHLSGYYKRCQPTCNNQLVIIGGYQPTFHDQWKSARILWQEDINNSLVITTQQPIGHDKWILAFLTNGLTSSYHDMRVDIFLSWHDGWYSLIIYFSKLICGRSLGLRRGEDFSVATGWLKGFVSGTDVRDLRGPPLISLKSSICLISWTGNLRSFHGPNPRFHLLVLKNFPVS